ncbi:hypothetical protein E4U55_007860 [Claviceps digitariae]|nr:hypothetical protein E4U55_007860 [Claviceps digitariae]
MADDPVYAADTTPNPFYIFNDAAFSLQSSTPTLPQGSCNFVNLTAGANGTKCGCRRFWPRQNVGSSLVDQTGWCMCAHHACYHDQQGPGPHDRLQLQQQYTEHQMSFAPGGRENEQCRDGPKPLSPVVDVTMACVEGTPPAMDFTAFSPGIPLSFVHDLPELTEETCKAHTHSPQPPGSMPDTLAWHDCLGTIPSARVCRQSGQPEALGVMSNPPTQQLVPSQTTSNPSSARIRDNSKPLGGQGLDALATEISVPDSSRLRKASLQDGGRTPSRLALQDDDRQRNSPFALVVGADDKAIECPQPETATQMEPRAVAAQHEQQPREALRSIYDNIYSHEARLDRLETVSFSAHGYEECSDKHDHTDLRVTDLEQRMDGVEKTLVQNAQNTDARDDDAATSVASAAASTASRLNPEEIMDQISNLQARVTHMQSFLPSHSFAWIVEVVFLPFPLNRLWQNMSQFKSDHAVSNDDWTQMPMTASSISARSQSPFGFGDDWAARKREAEWLHPRACGDKSTQDRRLRSRGLIQTVSFCEPDAKSVQTAIHKAFEPEFRTMGMTPRRDTSCPLASKYLALQETWVPLRKIHKDSRLRFLSAAELLTPASWDVNFLHSVTMKAVQPRLFITHPDAYIQDYTAYETGWTWQRIRDMEEVCPDVTESQEAREADAVEHCWHWNEQLDGAPKTLTVLNVRQSCERGSMSPSIGPGASASRRPLRSTSSSAIRESHHMMSGRRASRPPRIRTSSSPTVSAIRPVLVSAGHRGIVSRGQSRQSSPFARGLSQPGVQKRLRSTRSPSYPRHTPRWTVSPSPMPSGLPKRQGTRGMTPLAYATPHSNAPLQELRPIRSSSLVRKTSDPLSAAYATDELFDIEIYESGSDESCVENGNAGDEDDDDDDEGVEEEEDEASRHLVGYPHILHAMRHDSQDQQLPEDEPWPGIEDWPDAGGQGNHGPQHASADDDHHSSTSSQPSEYPATQRAWPMHYDDEAGFHIHED